MHEPAWPFLGSEVLAAKAIPERAMRTLYTPVYPGVYAPWGVELTACQRARAAWLWSRRRGVVAGNSAAALLGTKWVSSALDAELVYVNRNPPPRVRVYRDTLAPEERTTVDGMAVTTPARTAFDIGRRTVSRLHAVQRLDALANATGVGVGDVEAVMAAHPGVRGLKPLRERLPLVDGGAESPQETRTRLVLIDAGFPPPETQIMVYDEYGEFVARVDMGYRELKVGIEYDGPQHWTDPKQRQRDIDRQAALLALGWVIIRVTAELLRYREATFIARVDTAMCAAGWAGPPASGTLATLRRRVAS
ncbi:endonuclease domain-containing protein [Mycobacterium sp. pUA109]|uniref:endonuclease domain-containing protein n=1 Tax=Mycobacterium sp. pUA109 TaxID=3238982 RepID=UPI00351B35E8